MKNFGLINKSLGWLLFLGSFIVYQLTLEPTVSFWDCGEFIASAYKLQVGHSPGAPFFMILGRVFSLFASDPANVARMVNSMSAMASAGTIMFLFWTITHLARKMFNEPDQLQAGEMLAVLGAGLVGALAYTFSDTFWFSAVEGEVYALSSFFTAIVFWAILKWENTADEPYANRWLILIAYLMGLSIGIHLLNLLAIPAIVFVYYYRKYPVTNRGIFYAFLVSVLILGFMLVVVLKGFAKRASWFELLFVNGFGLPYHTGVFFYLALVIALFVIGIRYTVRKRMVVLNTLIVGFMAVMLGYSSYATIVIRSLANPPMDMNNPDDIFSLMSYLNREQYGETPLFRGPYYNAPIEGTKDGRPTYAQRDGKYVIINRKVEYEYDERFLTFFPRMHSADPRHVDYYKQFVEGESIRITDNQGESKVVKKPTFGENLKFFFSYQINHMYIRYFMWNFVGKQNDIQADGSVLKGNWLSGIKFIDEARLGSQEDLPGKWKNHEARNEYYFLPLLLGLLGLLTQINKNKRDAWVVGLLFIFTGLAIVVYLNQKPYEPRERDYAYAGSFYAFAIWIGLGVLAVYDALSGKIPRAISAIAATLTALVLVPGIMARENRDDHDRSGRYAARDIAFNYLNSCDENAVLFTNGDNDTYPLWYAQDVEGIRTDVRVANLMLLNMSWNIDQMKYKAYESEPLPITLTHDKYEEGTNGRVYMLEKIEDHVDLGQVIDFIQDDSRNSQLQLRQGLSVDYIPTKNFRLPVDSIKVILNGTVPPEDADKIVPEIRWQINRNSIMKSSMIQLDIIANNNWNRPVNFVAAGNEGALSLEKYFRMDGLSYRLVPIESTGSSFLNYGSINTDILYDRVMNTFRWGRINEPDVYLDHTTMHTLSVIKIRNIHSRLAEELIAEGKKDSAVVVLDRIMELTPHERIPYDIFVPPVIEAYYAAGEAGRADSIAYEFAGILENELACYLSLKPKFKNTIDYEIRLNLQILQNLRQITAESSDPNLNNYISEIFMQFLQSYSGQGIPMPPPGEGSE